MNKNLGLSLRLRIMRLLTLICFFHFSGLNNGITCMVVSSGKIESAGFAPVLISKVGAGLNPANWSSIASRQGWARVWSSSSRVIEISSQKAIRNMFMESTLFQVWMHNTLNPAESDSQSIALRPEISGMLKSLGRAGPDIAESEVQAGTRVLYLNTDYEDSWIKMERCALLKDGRLLPLFKTSFLLGESENVFRALHERQVLNRVRLAGRPGGLAPVRRIHYSSERSSDDPAEILSLKGRQAFSQITPKDSGVIFFLKSEGRAS